MNIILKRFRHKTDTIDGTLFIYGQKICDTAENAKHSLPPGSYPITILRCKHYRRKMPCILSQQQVPQHLIDEFFDSIGMATDQKLTNSKNWLEYYADFAESEQQRFDACKSCPSMACVSNNSNLPCFCPQIKIGNGVYNRIDGSIIIGERITWGCIKHPVEYFNRLIDRLDKAHNRCEPIILTIEG